MNTFIKLLLFSSSLLGCVSGHCDRDGKTFNIEKLKTRVFIYKYDGSKQCENKTGTDLDDMMSELSGIKVFSMFKKNDGQIRVQVCGALTGRANTYEIKTKDLSKAEAMGFKQWNF